MLRLVDLLQAPERLVGVTPDNVPALLGEIETLRAQLWGRLIGGRTAATEDVRQSDRLLTVGEAASLLHVTPRWLYRNHARLPFARPISRKMLRFSESALRDWVLRQHGRRGSRLFKMDG
jgi:predicted DNA-binding transcriptional regulator AlpA